MLVGYAKMVVGLPTGEQKDRLERIVAMASMGVPDTQIAEAVGLDQSMICIIRQGEDFKRMYGELMADQLAERAEMDEGWDGVEKQAIKIVSESLKWNKNPDFALKAALVANKAIRRGQSPLNAVLPTDMGPRVVINLNQSFVNKMQNIAAGIEDFVQSGVTAIEEKPTGPVKKVNLLTPSSVEDLLKPQLSEFEKAFLTLEKEELDNKQKTEITL